MDDAIIPRAAAPVEAAWRDRLRRRVANLPYLARSTPFLIGVGMLAFLVLFTTVGRLLIDTTLSEPLSAMPNQPPSWETPFGTDARAATSSPC